MSAATGAGPGAEEVAASPGPPPWSGEADRREQRRLRVQRAFVLGWHVAHAYHTPPPEDAEAVEPVEPALIGLHHLNPGSRYRLQLRMIEADILALRLDPEPDIDPPSARPIEARLATDAAQVGPQLYQLHITLLEALTVADFRLGQAYGLGRALAETALVPGTSSPEERAPALAGLLAPPRILELSRWLSALKSELPDHAAYATNRSLEAWRDLPVAVRDQDLDATAAALAAQGRVWRSLLSGEKAALDMLNEGDYVRAGEALVLRTGRLLFGFLRHFWWLLLIALAAVALVIWWIDATHLTSGGKVAASIAAGAAGLGVTVKSASGVLGKAAARLEGPLWQSELDESIAIATTRLPHSADPPKRRQGDTVGELRPVDLPVNPAPQPPGAVTS